MKNAFRLAHALFDSCFVLFVCAQVCNEIERCQYKSH